MWLKSKAKNKIDRNCKTGQLKNFNFVFKLSLFVIKALKKSEASICLFITASTFNQLANFHYFTVFKSRLSSALS